MAEVKEETWQRWKSEGRKGWRGARKFDSMRNFGREYSRPPHLYVPSPFSLLSSPRLLCPTHHNHFIFSSPCKKFNFSLHSPFKKNPSIYLCVSQYKYPESSLTRLLEWNKVVFLSVTTKIYRIVLRNLSRSLLSATTSRCIQLSPPDRYYSEWSPLE